MRILPRMSGKSRAAVPGLFFGCALLTAAAIANADWLPRWNQRGSAPQGEAAFSNELSLARLNERHGKIDNALEVYQAILRRDPDNRLAHHRIAVIASLRRDFETANAHFDHAASLGPPTEDLMADMGYSLYLQDRFAEAEQQLQSTLQQFPQSKRARNSLALVLAEQRRSDEALEHFKAVVGEAEAHANLAYIEAQMGDFPQATQRFHHALTLDKNNRPAAEALVQLHEHQQKLAAGKNNMALQNKSRQQQAAPADGRTSPVVSSHGPDPRAQPLGPADAPPGARAQQAIAPVVHTSDARGNSGEVQQAAHHGLPSSQVTGPENFTPLEQPVPVQRPPSARNATLDDAAYRVSHGAQSLSDAIERNSRPLPSHEVGNGQRIPGAFVEQLSNPGVGDSATATPGADQPAQHGLPVGFNQGQHGGGLQASRMSAAPHRTGPRVIEIAPPSHMPAGSHGYAPRGSARGYLPNGSRYTGAQPARPLQPGDSRLSEPPLPPASYGEHYQGKPLEPRHYAGPDMIAGSTADDTSPDTRAGRADRVRAAQSAAAERAAQHAEAAAQSREQKALTDRLVQALARVEKLEGTLQTKQDTAIAAGPTDLNAAPMLLRGANAEPDAVQQDAAVASAATPPAATAATSRGHAPSQGTSTAENAKKPGSTQAFIGRWVMIGFFLVSSLGCLALVLWSSRREEAGEAEAELPGQQPMYPQQAYLPMTLAHSADSANPPAAAGRMSWIDQPHTTGGFAPSNPFPYHWQR